MMAAAAPTGNVRNVPTKQLSTRLIRDAFFIRSMITMQMKMSRIILPISAKIAECNKLRLWYEWLAWEMQWTHNELILSHVWHNLRRFCYVTIIHLILWFTWQKHLNMRVWHSLIHFCACRFYLFFKSN